jgi:hypothetical protein
VEKAEMALGHARLSRVLGSEGRRECRIYPCPEGYGYHLTSMASREPEPWESRSLRMETEVMAAAAATYREDSGARRVTVVASPALADAAREACRGTDLDVTVLPLPPTGLAG